MELECHTPLATATAPDPEPRRPANRVDDADLLRAAHECVLANGLRRTKLTDVARRAGVSRMTLYRRFPDVDNMVTTLVTLEFGEIVQLARAAKTDGTARDRLVAVVVRGIQLLHEAPLLQRVLETDGELLLPYLVERLGSTQLAAEELLLDYLGAGHADGSIRPADPAVQARSLLLLVQSFVISTRPATKDIDTDSLTAELAHLLEGALHPGSKS